MKVHLNKRQLSSGGYTLYLDYHLNGRRVRDFLKIHVLPKDPSAKDKNTLAERIRAQREIDLSSDHHGAIPSHRKKLNFFQYFQGFIDSTTRKDPRLFVASLTHLKEYHKKEVLPANEITPASNF